MTTKFVLLTLSSILLMAAGCTVFSDEPGAIEPEITTGSEDNAPPAGEPPTRSLELSAGETPQELFDSVVNDALVRSGKDRSAVEVLKSEAVEWPDGSLGCPQPGMMYTQAIVNGYHIILALGDAKYDYRLTDRGAFVLCQNPAASGPGETVTK